MCNFQLNLYNVLRKKRLLQTVLDAIYFSNKAWQQINPQTIRNCFQHAKFISEEDGSDECDNMHLKAWLNKFGPGNLIVQQDISYIMMIYII